MSVPPKAMPILNPDGTPAIQPATVHRFGEFALPENCHIKGFEKLDAHAPAQDANDEIWNREHAKLRSQTRPPTPRRMP